MSKASTARIVTSKTLGALTHSLAHATSSKALGALAVAQRDISRAQFCAREISR